MFQSFTDALRAFVSEEYEAQARQVRETWAQPIAARVAGGEAIADVEVVTVEFGRAALRCRDNLSRFRPPEPIRISRGDPINDEHLVRCTLEEDRGAELIVSGRLNGLKPGGGYVIDRDVIDTRRILLAALDSLDLMGGSNRIISLLQGTLTPEIDAAREAVAYERGGKLGMNASQREAFARAYAADNYYLIQGPPGTGKTWVLAHLATALAQEGGRVLITAFTHRAINNALRKIEGTTRYPHIFKVGERAHADDLGSVANYEDFSASGYTAEQRGIIVGATCFAARSTRLRNVRFDAIIFDEAGQVTLPIAIAGMLSGRKYIFIGDHQQMRPVIAGEHRDARVIRSVFETLYAHAPGTMLDTTYRMNAAINAFPSRHFYGGGLKTTPEVQTARLHLSRPPAHYADLLDPAYPDVFAAVPHTGRQMRSPEEADIAAGVAAEAIACGLPPGEIAIVAPYRAQGRLIRQRLADLLGASQIDPTAVVVDTVERMQGQERDMVIISLTTSDPAHAARNAEFYFQPNRLNVAITRPRVKRIVIGSPALFSAQPPDPQHRMWVAIFRQFYAQSHVIQITSPSVQM